MTSTARNHLLDGLRRIVGPAHVLTPESPGTDLSAWEQDWRKRSRGQAMAVVRPASTDEVAAIIGLCGSSQPETGVSIVPQGGNTSMVVGAVPDDSGRQIVLSLQRMNRILALDAANLTLTAEAGCILQTLQEHARAAGFLLPLSLAAEGSCTIGGNLGTNAGGTQVVRYGNTRDLCLGLQVVTAQGQVWDGLSGLRKDNTGYDLRNLFVGSEGTLGVITAATMKLAPLPAAQMTAWMAVPSLEHCVELLALAQRALGAGLTGFEAMGQEALRLVARHGRNRAVPFVDTSPWCVLLELSDLESEEHARTQFEHLLEKAMQAGLVTDGVVAESLSQAAGLWQFREDIPTAQASEGANVKHDISIPISRIPAFVRETDAAVTTALPGSRMINFGHLGDGNLHYNVQPPVGIDPQTFLTANEAAINAIVFDSVVRHGGSISAEHGIGSLKVDKLPGYKSAVALDLMRTIKRALDPTNLLNPGRVVRV